MRYKKSGQLKAEFYAHVSFFGYYCGKTPKALRGLLECNPKLYRRLYGQFDPRKDALT